MASSPSHSDEPLDTLDSFEGLFRRHYPHLRNYGRRFTHRTTLVDDAIQDVFMALWRSDTNVDDLEQPRSYLLSSLRRRLLKQVQAERERRTQRSELADAPPDFALSQEDLLAAHDHQKQQQAKIEKALQTLSERRREALYLRFYHGCTHREIAGVMDIAYQTARNYVSEALLHIREYVKKVDAS